MVISTKSLDGVDIVFLSGSLDTNTAPPTEDHLNSLINGGSDKILINMSGVDYISSAGLRILLAASKKLEKREGKLRFCSLNETVREVFDISGFSMIFDLFESGEKAMEEF